MLHLQKEDFSSAQDNIVVHIDRKSIIQLHSHNFLEFAYVTEGSATSVIDGVKTTIKKGDYFIIDYGTEHVYESDAPFEIVNILFLPKLIDKSLIYCKSLSVFLNHYLIKIDESRLTCNPSGQIFSDENGSIFACVQKICREYEKKELGYTEIMRSILIEILLLTMRKISSDDGARPFADFVKGSVEGDYVNPPTLSQIAEKFHYSIPYASEKIKKTLGVCYRDYVAQVRVNEAKRLLANTDKKIRDVARGVGYNDVNFFYTVFKLHEGVSPAVFRKSINGTE